MLWRRQWLALIGGHAGESTVAVVATAMGSVSLGAGLCVGHGLRILFALYLFQSARMRYRETCLSQQSPFGELGVESRDRAPTRF